MKQTFLVTLDAEPHELTLLSNMIVSVIHDCTGAQAEVRVLPTEDNQSTI